jgi:hypothetical protein
MTLQKADTHPMPASTLYVNANATNTGDGTATNPYRTLTAALQQSKLGTLIFVGAGTYSSGEIFPLVIPAGVSLLGDVPSRGPVSYTHLRAHET